MDSDRPWTRRDVIAVIVGLIGVTAIIAWELATDGSRNDIGLYAFIGGAVVIVVEYLRRRRRRRS
jgi:uncharacterized membrane protein HdeD (DUF308 family)